jgi:hypothetical protein
MRAVHGYLQVCLPSPWSCLVDSKGGNMCHDSRYLPVRRGYFQELEYLRPYRMYNDSTNWVALLRSHS